WIFVTALRSDQRILRIGGETLGFGSADFLTYDVRSSDERDGLVIRVTAAHAFAAHSAIGTHSETLGSNVFERLTQQIGDFLGAFNLKCVVIDHADRDLLAGDPLADRFEIQRI